MQQFVDAELLIQQNMMFSNWILREPTDTENAKDFDDRQEDAVWRLRRPQQTHQRQDGRLLGDHVLFLYVLEAQSGHRHTTWQHTRLLCGTRLSLTGHTRTAATGQGRTLTCSILTYTLFSNYTSYSFPMPCLHQNNINIFSSETCLLLI